jgi:hypothetical protein
MSEKSNTIEWEIPKKNEAQLKSMLFRLDEIFSKLMEQYEPATPETAELRMTTQQIYSQMISFFPSEYTAEVICDLMKKSGFTFEIAGSGMDFYWLLKAKS